MENEITTPDSQLDEVDVASANEEVASSSVELKDLLNQELGKNYPDNETALKSLKEMQRYVGKVGKVAPLLDKLQAKYGSESEVLKIMEDLTAGTPQIDESKYVSREQYETDSFFARHQELEPHREIIEALKVKTGKPLNEVVQLDAFKGVFEKAKAYDEVEKSKSILQTNPRLGAVSDKIAQARESVDKNPSQANRLAVESVLDAFERN